MVDRRPEVFRGKGSKEIARFKAGIDGQRQPVIALAAELGLAQNGESPVWMKQGVEPSGAGFDFWVEVLTEDGLVLDQRIINPDSQLGDADREYVDANGREVRTFFGLLDENIYERMLNQTNAKNKKS